MDFTFNRFSTRSFERFSQALAIRYLGPGLEVYGDGPDGAREASYRGRLSFPDGRNPWDGYTIVQAKFRQSPANTGDDAAWLVEQMREELAKFIDPDWEGDKPEFYLLITNAKLSPVPATKRGKGGIEKVKSLFEEYKGAIGLRGYAIWHYDELCARLADSDSIRRSHAAWVTSSDVLTAVMDGLVFTRADFGEVMHRFLQRELRNQRPTRLQQAGHAGEAATFLEEVFIDLPVESTDEGQREDRDKLIVREMISRSSENLKPSLGILLRKGEARPEDRILLMGGPGQGKSTVSQYYAQLLRARILKSETCKVLTSDIPAIIGSVIGRADEIDLNVGMPLRFPIRIELPLFADALASAKEKEETLSLIQYICRYVALVATEPDLSIVDLRLWMKSYPFAILLDGLDEVPPSANRSETISAVNEFWDEVTGADSDVFMLVTTRPQGYNDDLDPSVYNKLEMSRLKPEHALLYARRLARARLGDPSQQQRVIERLEEATRNSTTSHLLVSPLQVAIMLALIDQRGEAPSDRWTLFDKYYNVVLEREQQKHGAGGRVVKKWGRLIGALHQTIGFALHLSAETSGAADSYVSKSDLEALVRYQLSLDGYEGEKLDNAVLELCEVTTDRLVLLVERVDQRYSFEVRSLQEFMAASYLMSGKDVIVQERLREIANKSHWRHVFLIASSKCFSSNDNLHFRDTIIGICRELDSGDPVDFVLKSGARLAISLLDDGLAHDQPRARRQLLLSAIEHVHTGAVDTASSLAQLIEDDSQHAINFLRPLLSGGLNEARKGAWRLLFEAGTTGQSWAVDLILQNWPNAAKDKIALIALSPAPTEGSALEGLFLRAFEHAAPLDIIDTFGIARMRVAVKAQRFIDSLPLLDIIRREGNQEKAPIKTQSGEWPLSFEFVSVITPQNLQDRIDLMPVNKAWAPVRAVLLFHLHPNRDVLASTWRDIVKNGWVETVMKLSRIVPWPLLTLVQLFHDSPASVDEDLLSGIGDYADWVENEKRWKKSGITSTDLDYFASNGLAGFSKQLGLCWPTLISLSSVRKGSAWLNELIRLVSHSQMPARRLLSWVVGFALSLRTPRPLVTSEDAKRLLLDIGDDFFDRSLDPKLIGALSAEAIASDEVAGLLARRAEDGRLFIRREADRGVSEMRPTLLNHCEKHPGMTVVLANTFGLRSNILTCSDLLSHSRSHVDSDNSHVRALMQLCQLMAGNVNVGTSSIIDEVKPRYSWAHLLDVLKADIFDEQHGLDIAVNLVRASHDRDDDEYESFLSQTSRLADRRQSHLAEKNCWTQLELPEVLCNPTERIWAR